jgi:hypothetical protein
MYIAIVQCDSNSQSSKWSLQVYNDAACDGTPVSASGSYLHCTTVNVQLTTVSIAVDCSGLVTDHSSPASTLSSSIGLATAAAVGVAAVMLL